MLTDRFGRVHDWRSNVDWSRNPRGNRNRDDGSRDPHWYPADADGHYSWIDGPTITTTTTTSPGEPIVTKTVRYVTDYVTVPGRRTKYLKRSKYVPL